MDINYMYKCIFNATVTGGVQEIMDAAYKVIELPILLSDICYNVIATTHTYNLNDSIWNTMIKEKQAPSDLVLSFHNSNYIDTVCNSNKPVYLDWGVVETPHICAPVRINGIVTHYLGVICPLAKFNESIIEGVDILAKALSIAMKNQKHEQTQKNPLNDIFTRDLLNGNILDNDQLETWEFNFGHFFKKNYIVAAISPKYKGEFGILKYFSSNLSKIYSNMLSTIINDVLFLIFNNIYSQHDVNNIKNTIIKTISPYQANISVSKVFSNILDTNKYKFQLLNSLRFGPIFNPERNVFSYEDYAIPTIFSFSLKEMDKVNYVHPIIYELYRFDNINNTDYLNTLETYILNFCKAKIVSEKLHIHRNTLLYRLNKISEITNCNIKDENTCIELLISFEMLKLTNNDKYNSLIISKNS